MLTYLTYVTLLITRTITPVWLDILATPTPTLPATSDSSPPCQRAPHSPRTRIDNDNPFPLKPLPSDYSRPPNHASHLASHLDSINRGRLLPAKCESVSAHSVESISHENPMPRPASP